MASGLTSYTKTDTGKRQLDIAELDRRYPKRDGFDPNKTESTTSETSKSNDNNHLLEKALLEQKILSLEKEVEIKNEAIEQWQKAFDKAQSTADKITALLEHQSTQYSKSDKMESLEREMKAIKAQNDDLLAKEKMRLKRQEERRAQKEKEKQAEIERRFAEQNKSLFQKLFR